MRWKGGRVARGAGEGLRIAVGGVDDRRHRGPHPTPSEQPIQLRHLRAREREDMTRRLLSACLPEGEGAAVGEALVEHRAVLARVAVPAQSPTAAVSVRVTGCGTYSDSAQMSQSPDVSVIQPMIEVWGTGWAAAHMNT